MYGYHVVGVFPSDAVAQNAKAQLVSAGVYESSIHISTEARRGSSGRSSSNESSGFFDWLFGHASPEHERDWYEQNLRGGQAALSVLVHEDEDHIPIAEMLVRAGALNLSDERESGGETRGTSRPGRSSATNGRGHAQDEEVIPIINEELVVGKKATENRYRVRAHVVEKPVEQNVNLRDERVVIERRPASGAGRDYGARDWQDRDYEVIERHEEPVAQKRARANEEVVIRKDVRDRNEVVRDTVRETEIDMDDQRSGRSGARKRV